MDDELNYRRYRDELEQRWNQEYRSWRRANELARIAHSRGTEPREGPLKSLGEAIFDVIAAPASPLAEAGPAGVVRAGNLHGPDKWR